MSLRNCHFARCTGVALLAALLLVRGAAAQDGASAGASEGAVGEGSTNVGDGSGSVGDASSGSMRSGPVGEHSRPVRDGRRNSMLSGPVSELGAGPVRNGQSVYGGGPIGATSRGAVTQPEGLPPLRMERPLSEAEMRQLEADLRAVEPLP